MSEKLLYETIKIKLEPKTRSLIITMIRPPQENTINLKLISELEKIFKWAAEHLEIYTIFFTNQNDMFGEGLDPTETSRMNRGDFQNFLNKVLKFTLSLFQLPQTLIVDFKKGSSGSSIELALAADIRIIHEEGTLRFDHLYKGKVPSCGGIGVLSELIPPSFLKSWIISGDEISPLHLKASGLIHDSYLLNDCDYSLKLRQKCLLQAPVQRIQMKKALLERMTKKLEKHLSTDEKILNGGLMAEDWKEYHFAKEEGRTPQYTSPKEFAQKVKNFQLKNHTDIDPQYIN